MAITFLFGSGADTDYCDKLKSGASFSAAGPMSRFSTS